MQCSSLLNQYGSKWEKKLFYQEVTTMDATLTYLKINWLKIRQFKNFNALAENSFVVVLFLHVH